MNLDKTNKKILSILSLDARISWSELGKKVHLTPQAVAVRVNKLIEIGIIQKFTIKQKHENEQRHFITIFLDNKDYQNFEDTLCKNILTDKFYKISGRGCYHLEIVTKNNFELDNYLNLISEFGRYSLSSNIKQIM